MATYWIDRFVIPGRTAALDFARLRELEDVTGDESFLSEILHLYAQYGPGLVDDLLRATNRGDSNGLVEVAHSLKSSAANVGARRLSELCGEIESQSRAGPAIGPGVTALIAEVVGESTTVIAEIAVILASPSATRGA